MPSTISPGDVLEQHVPVLRCELRVPVVLADEDHRQMHHRGEVGGLVEGADVRRTVTEEGDGDRVAALVDGGERRAHGVRDTATDDAVRAEHADAEVVDVHAAAAALAVAGGLAEQLGVHELQVRPLRDRVAVAAVRRGDDVVIAQRRHDAGGHCFLADVEVQEAGHPPAFHELARLLLEEPDTHHSAVQIEQHFWRQGRNFVFGSCLRHFCSASPRMSTCVARYRTCRIAGKTRRSLKTIPRDVADPCVRSGISVARRKVLHGYGSGHRSRPRAGQGHGRTPARRRLRRLGGGLRRDGIDPGSG
jgi:hypothetical protein